MSAVWNELKDIKVFDRSISILAEDYHLIVTLSIDSIVTALEEILELGLPVLGQGSGAGYIPYYRETLRRLRAGAPESGCLVITPLDQAMLTFEMNTVAQMLKTETKCGKINTASLGNRIRQLHVHVVAQPEHPRAISQLIQARADPLDIRIRVLLVAEKVRQVDSNL